MLVSAAMDPYRKSYGNAARSSATLCGSNASERSTASPRNTWVPGVHANAGDGNTAIATTAIAAAITRGIAAVRTPVGPRVTLYAEPFALTTNGLPQIAQLRLDDVGHCFPRRVDRVANFLANCIDGNAIPDLPAVPGRPPGATASAFTRPPRRGRRCTARYPRNWRERTPSARPAPQQQRRPCADHRAQDGGGQQIVLLVTRVRLSAVGRAVARAIHSRFHRCRHGSPLRLRAPRRPRT